MIYTCVGEHANCDAPPTKRPCSCGMDLLTLNEYHINKHFTGVQAPVTYRPPRSRSANTQCNCFSLGTHYSVYMVTLTVCLHCHTVLIATKLFCLMGGNPLLHQLPY